MDVVTVGVVRDFVVGKLGQFCVDEIDGFNCRWSFVVSFKNIGCGFSFDGDLVIVERWRFGVDGIYCETLCVGDPLFFVKFELFLDGVALLDDGVIGDW